jgi:glucose 1-dehydrogenase
MRAITVRPGQANSAQLAEVAEPPLSDGADTGGLNRTMVLQNHAVFGTVNANRAHYRAAADALAKADRGWLKGLISRRVPLEHWHEAPERRPDDITVVIEFA